MALIKKEFIRVKKEPFILEPEKMGFLFQKLSSQEELQVLAKTKSERILTESDEGIRSKAYEQAQRIVEEAEQKARELLETSRKEGLEQGKQDGWQQVGGYIKDALETLNQAIIEKNKIIKSSEPEVLKLAIKIAEQIIKSEVSLNRDVCLSIVSEAISKITDREQVIIHVNQANLEQVRGQRERLAAMIDGVKNLTIQEDSQIESGGCVIETNLGFVDAKIGTKLVAIEEALKKVMGSEEETLEKGAPEKESQKEATKQDETTG